MARVGADRCNHGMRKPGSTERASRLLRRPGKPEPRGLGGCLPAGLDIELPKDRGDVMIDGLFGDDQALCDLGVPQAFHDQREYLELACGETGRVLTRSGARPVSSVRDAPR